MEIEIVKQELRQLRKMNKKVNQSINFEQMYMKRLSILDKNENDREIRYINRRIKALKTVDKIRSETMLEDKYFGILNELPDIKRTISLMLFIQAEDIDKICNALYMDKQVLYNEISKIYKMVWRKINEMESNACSTR